MTKSELIQQALTEYETANGRPATDAVKIAQKLNRKGRSASVDIVPEAKDAADVADEAELLAYVRSEDPDNDGSQPIKLGASHRISKAKKNATNNEKLDALWQEKNAEGIIAKRGSDTSYLYRADFGTDTLQREVTTTTETPSRAEVELGEGVMISRKDVVNEMKAN